MNYVTVVCWTWQEALTLCATCAVQWAYDPFCLRCLNSVKRPQLAFCLLITVFLLSFGEIHTSFVWCLINYSDSLFPNWLDVCVWAWLLTTLTFHSLRTHNGALQIIRRQALHPAGQTKRDQPEMWVFLSASPFSNRKTNNCWLGLSFLRWVCWLSTCWQGGTLILLRNEF